MAHPQLGRGRAAALAGGTLVGRLEPAEPEPGRLRPHGGEGHLQVVVVPVIAGGRAAAPRKLGKRHLHDAAVRKAGTVVPRERLAVRHVDAEARVAERCHEVSERPLAHGHGSERAGAVAASQDERRA
eukprot:4228931-Prymnesium_polylepis.1